MPFLCRNGHSNRRLFVEGSVKKRSPNGDVSAQGRRPGKAGRRIEGKDRTGATRWGAHHRPVNAISPAVSPSFRAMSLCDNCRIKSTHYCVTAFRRGPARYYGHSACPRNGGPTRRRAVDIVLQKDSFFGPIASELMGISAERRRRGAATAIWQISLLSFPRRRIVRDENSYRVILFFRYIIAALYYIPDI